jgi:hypothetical protein
MISRISFGNYAGLDSILWTGLFWLRQAGILTLLGVFTIAVLDKSPIFKERREWLGFSNAICRNGYRDILRAIGTIRIGPPRDGTIGVITVMTTGSKIHHDSLISPAVG